VKKFLLILSSFVFFECYSQLTSIGFSYGIGGVQDLNKKMKFPMHEGHLDFNVYLAKSISVGLNLNYRNIKLNQLTVDSIPIPAYSALSIGLNFKWWFLNDFRLKKKAGSKGSSKLYALTYPFRMYLLADFGYSFNLTKGNPNLNRGTMFAGGGIGINIWQFQPKKKSGIGSGTAKYFIIPFIEAIYNHHFKDYLRTDMQEWKPHALDIKIGLKIAFDKY
jgi:hypothetical protein